MDWFTRLLYLGCILAILILGAIALYVLFLLYGTQYDSEEAENKENTVIRVDKRRCSKCKHCFNKAIGLKTPNSNSNAPAKIQPDIIASIPMKQAMFSLLKQSANDSDVVLVRAISSVPLKELGGFNNDIIVDVSQQIHLNKDELKSEDYKCILCKNHDEIKWSDVKCFAQTKIGVLVCKRTPVEQKPIFEMTDGIVKRDSDASDFFDKHKTVSNLTLAPIPDSRLTIKQPLKGITKTTSPLSPTTSSRSA